MQAELDNATASLDIQILGVNRIGDEGDNGTITQGRQIPWLQDTMAEGVWDSWAVTWRDVVVFVTLRRTRVHVLGITVRELRGGIGSYLLCRFCVIVN